jgi:hypothetical protein
MYKAVSFRKATTPSCPHISSSETDPYRSTYDI